jgi:hypothetical protein
LAWCGGLDPHERIFVKGRTQRLRNPLYHYSYHDIADHLTRINRFTQLSAGELRNAGKRWRWRHSLVHPPFRLFRSFVWKRGFLEGNCGFFVAATAAFYVFMKYAKLRELELKEKSDGERERD